MLNVFDLSKGFKGELFLFQDCGLGSFGSESLVLYCLVTWHFCSMCSGFPMRCLLRKVWVYVSSVMAETLG